MKKAIKEIVVPILNNEYKVVVCFGPSAELEKVLKRRGFPDYARIAPCLDQNRGMTFVRDDCHPVIALPQIPKLPDHIGTLAHEAAHAVEHICSFINAPFTGELAAHSIGAIVRESLKALKNESTRLNKRSVPKPKNPEHSS